jgi:tetratricopeptide (TPR) repeat protein
MRTARVVSRGLLAIGFFLIAAPGAGAQSAGSLERGVRLFEAGEHAEAKRVLLPLAEQNPGNARAAFYVGQIFRHEGNVDRGIEWLERAIRLDPASSDYHLNLAGAYGDKAQRANAVRQAMLARKAKSHLDEAVRLSPESLDARFGLVQFYTIAPGVMGGSKARAREQAAEIQRRNPYRGAMATGMILESEKNFAAAEAEYRRSLRQYPDSITLYYRIASAAGAQEQYDRAFEILEEMARRKPDEMGALYQIGRVSAVSGQRLERGEEALRSYLRRPAPRGPSPAASHWRLGMILEKQGRRDQARAEYQAALRLDPGHREARAALRKLGE